jgi:hypothetical protein
MKKSILFLLMVIVLSIGLTNCKSNKISCPAYGDNKPPSALPKGSRTSSGVMPGDGHGKKTKVPK